MSKKTKFRKNIKPFVDADFKHKLNKEDLAYYEKFEKEYYANELNRVGSIHRESLNEEEFQVAKKETFAANNSQNRDVYGIAATSPSYLKFLEESPELQIAYASNLNSIFNPTQKIHLFIEEAVDEIDNGGRNLKVIIEELCVEMVKIGIYLRNDKIVKSRKRKNKEDNDEI